MLGMYLAQNRIPPNLRSWIETWLLPRRLWVIGFLAFVFIALEIMEETVSFRNGRIYSEILSIGMFFVLLLIILLLLEYLLGTIKTKNHALAILQIKHDLSTQLTLTIGWESLIDLLLKFPQSIAPLMRTSLLIYNPQSAKFDLAAEKNHQATSSQPIYPFQIPEICYINDAQSDFTVYTVELIAPPGETPEAEMPNSYCLPLVFDNKIIAKLILILSPPNTLSPEQTDILNHVAPDMAIALASAQQQKEQVAFLINKAKDTERLSISRDLHDTLGQNLAYLRLTLEHLVRDIDKKTPVELHTELTQMGEVANKSYELVRGTLSILHTEEAIPLNNLLLDHSRLVVDRSKFEVNITQTGQPRQLSPELLWQIFYIFGEALSNVERHAGAQEVSVTLIWNEQDLTIKIIDNGLGFDPTRVQYQQHFGLTIMQERTLALGGRFDLKSTNDGTELSFWFPLNNYFNERVNIVL